MTEVYLYRYICRRWWGPTSDLQMARVPEGADLLSALQVHAEAVCGSKTCNVDILQKFRLSMEVAETYDAMATLPVTQIEECSEEN
jgi:hypothetical protein